MQCRLRDQHADCDGGDELHSVRCGKVQHGLNHSLRHLRSRPVNGHGHCSDCLSRISLRGVDGADGANFVHVVPQSHVLGDSGLGLCSVLRPDGLGGRGNGLLRAHRTAQHATLKATFVVPDGTAFEVPHWTAD